MYPPLLFSFRVYRVLYPPSLFPFSVYLELDPPPLFLFRVYLINTVPTSPLTLQGIPGKYYTHIPFSWFLLSLIQGYNLVIMLSMIQRVLSEWSRQVKNDREILLCQRCLLLRRRQLLVLFYYFINTMVHQFINQK